MSAAQPSFLTRLCKHRFGPVALLVAVIVVIAFLTRAALLLYSAGDVDWTGLSLPGIFLIGLFYDLVMSSYFIIPLVLYLWLVPDKLYRQRWQRFLLYGLMTILCFILVFNIAGEWFFWEEFSSRYNFIAVNYLVYTNEVIGNIRESYPLNGIITGVAILTLIIVFLLRKKLKLSMIMPLRFGKRTLWALGLLLLPVISFLTVNHDFPVQQ